ncbi:hypothetical protein BaRGS_00028550 [Batillaria attramentaria]|uniref:RING-type domain-containing protein n=1 Tax=Batillaria attramentaria TaxID=370345 RepID=A0ABD0JZL0_9CAEN
MESKIGSQSGNKLDSPPFRDIQPNELIPFENENDHVPSEETDDEEEDLHNREGELFKENDSEENCCRTGTQRGDASAPKQSNSCNTTTSDCEKTRIETPRTGNSAAEDAISTSLPKKQLPSPDIAKRHADSEEGASVSQLSNIADSRKPESVKFQDTTPDCRSKTAPESLPLADLQSPATTLASAFVATHHPYVDFESLQRKDKGREDFHTRRHEGTRATERRDMSDEDEKLLANCHVSNKYFELHETKTRGTSNKNLNRNQDLTNSPSECIDWINTKYIRQLHGQEAPAEINEIRATTTEPQLRQVEVHLENVYQLDPKYQFLSSEQRAQKETSDIETKENSITEYMAEEPSIAVELKKERLYGPEDKCELGAAKTVEEKRELPSDDPAIDAPHDPFLSRYLKLRDGNHGSSQVYPLHGREGDDDQARDQAGRGQDQDNHNPDNTPQRPARNQNGNNQNGNNNNGNNQNGNAARFPGQYDEIDGRIADGHGMLDTATQPELAVPNQEHTHAADTGTSHAQRQDPSSAIPRVSPSVPSNNGSSNAPGPLRRSQGTDGLARLRHQQSHMNFETIPTPEVRISPVSHRGATVPDQRGCNLRYGQTPGAWVSHAYGRPCPLARGRPPAPFPLLVVPRVWNLDYTRPPASPFYLGVTFRTRCVRVDETRPFAHNTPVQCEAEQPVVSVHGRPTQHLRFAGAAPGAPLPLPGHLAGAGYWPICRICSCHLFIHSPAVVFFSCSHIAVCRVCAPAIRYCPLCNEMVLCFMVIYA